MHGEFLFGIRLWRLKKPGLIIGIVMMMGVGSAEREDGGVGARVLAVDVIRIAESSGYGIERSYTGTVEASRRSRLGFEVGGTLTMLGSDDGDAVSAGGVLARLDDRILQAELKREQAREREAQAALELAETTFSRVSGLIGDGAVSEQDVDEARRQFLSAKAILESAHSGVELLHRRLEKLEISAPYDCLIVKRHVDEGSIVTPGQIIFDVRQTGSLEVRMGVPPDIARTIVKGQSVDLTGLSGNIVGQAVIQAVVPEVDSQTRTVEIVMNPVDHRLWFPGDLVVWRLEERVDEKCFILPRRALTGSVRGLWSAYAVVPATDRPGQSVLEARTVEILHTLPDRVVVRGGLRAGDLVVRNGLHRVVPGQLVTFVTPDN